MPSAASMLSSSLPAWPTKGSPLTSSSAPGPSPTNSQSGFRSPTPSTACLRCWNSGQALQAATPAARSGQFQRVDRQPTPAFAEAAGPAERPSALTPKPALFPAPALRAASRRRQIGVRPISASICSRVRLIAVPCRKPARPRARQPPDNTPAARRSAKSRNGDRRLSPADSTGGPRAAGAPRPPNAHRP